jgi:hypothetical protein
MEERRRADRRRANVPLFVNVGGTFVEDRRKRERRRVGARVYRLPDTDATRARLARNLASRVRDDGLRERVTRFLAWVPADSERGVLVAELAALLPSDDEVTALDNALAALLSEVQGSPPDLRPVLERDAERLRAFLVRVTGAS